MVGSAWLSPFGDVLQIGTCMLFKTRQADGRTDT